MPCSVLDRPLKRYPRALPRPAPEVCPVPRRTLALAGALAATLVIAAPAAADFSPGAPGAGDPYYPFAGNGGYDVSHYDLELSYERGPNVLEGEAVITAMATQDLSRF